ncbi:uncharacterized protein LOC108669104 [Hyalella azteca]|uniref:Uncharacterized protein LOC108669104 n=1 Tax=Hyalella azteca TaxID=294128 RepID=A0A8B7NE45_HYAAZ|nr:uncharacterized protein LOC108669104 [Hyalella azteca]
MKRLGNYIFRALFFASLTSEILCQGNENCSATPSRRNPGSMDIMCTCMQSLQQRVQNVDALTIDRSGCEVVSALDISWNLLEHGIGPRTVTFIGAQIILTNPPNQSWNTSISRITFERCLFDSIPPKSFEGLSRLTELRFINNYIGNVSSYSISGLPNLRTVEFADSDIVNIHTSAISDLPALFEMAFVRTSISSLADGAVKIIRTPQLPANNDCPKIDIRIPPSDRMSDVMARSLESVDNLPLPEIGARLHFYFCNITALHPKAISSDWFSFVIFYGNRVSTFGTGAFQLTMDNQCEISAVMLVGNYFKSIQLGAVASIQKKQQANRPSYLVLTNNTFEFVAAKGFVIHPSIEVYSVADNKFVCECPNFAWLMSNSETPRQQEIERNLKASATCNYNSISVTTFTDSCPKRDMASYPSTEIVVVTLPDEVMYSSAVSIVHNQPTTGFLQGIFILSLVGRQLLSHF